MLKSLKLHEVGLVPELTASFGERLNIIMGDNGMGKSFLLDVCFWTLTGTWPGGRMAIPDIASTEPTITCEIQSKTKPVPREAKYDFPFQTWTRQRGRLRSFAPLTADAVERDLNAGIDWRNPN